MIVSLMIFSISSSGICADEVISPENRQKFQQLKENLLPEIEIVQMLYGNQLQFGTVYNYILEKEMATHSGTLAWKIPWTEKPT